MKTEGREERREGTEPSDAPLGSGYRPQHADTGTADLGAAFSFALALTSLVAVVAIDTLGIDRGLWDESEPHWSLAYWARTALCAVAGIATVHGLVRINGGRRSATGVVLNRFDRLAVLAIPAGALFFVLLLPTSPRYFTRFALEDRPVEWVSVLLLFVACALTVLAVRQVAASKPDQRWLLLGPLALAVVFFLIAMEEVSWFQRVLSVETPDALASNAQGELNFHNFATGLSENGYYFGAFVALMIVPLALQAFRIELPGPLAPFTPTPVVALVSAPAFAFNFDMWDIALSQVAFYGAVAVLVLWVVHEVDPGDRRLVLAMAGSTVAVQLMMLLFGDRSDLIWDATEYKEMFIPIGFATYSVDVYRRLRAGQADATTQESLEIELDLPQNG